MKRHPLPRLAIAAVVALGLSACGDDSESTPVTQPTTDVTLPPVDTTPDDTSTDGIQYPTGADDVVLRVGYEGGFVPVEYAFLNGYVPTERSLPL